MSSEEASQTECTRSALVKLNGRLSQFIREEARADSTEPNANYWEENWKGIDEKALRHALRPTKRLGVCGPFFHRHLAPGGRVLEAGCGTGLWMSRLRENGYHVTGLDYAVRSLSRSKAIVPDLEVSAGDLRRLPYRDESFDAYMSFGVIEHFFDGPGKILEEAFRVLKPGGVILVSTPFMNVFRRKAEPIPREEAESLGLRFHQFYYSLEELQASLSEAGFGIVRAHLNYSAWHGFAEVAPELEKILLRIPGMGTLAQLADFVPILSERFAHMIFAVGRKPA